MYIYNTVLFLTREFYICVIMNPFPFHRPLLPFSMSVGLSISCSFRLNVIFSLPQVLPGAGIRAVQTKERGVGSHRSTASQVTFQWWRESRRKGLTSEWMYDWLAELGVWVGKAVFTVGCWVCVCVCMFNWKWFHKFHNFYSLYFKTHSN